MHRAMIAVLIEAREAAGLSQRDVARRMKRKATFAHLVELGERMLAVPELPEYAKALDLTSEVVVARMEELARSGHPIPPRVDARKRRKKRST
jgi:transcriptional regulator with XRE-family HTH domain